MTLFMIELRVNDWPAACRWYQDVLGLVVELEDAPNRFLLLKTGTARLALKEGDRGSADAVDLVFEVDDVDRARSELVARGATVEGPFPSPHGEPYRELRLRDPEGTSIRLFSWIDR
jgi:predicted enzyme related to lactoylglutathione lyase